MAIMQRLACLILIAACCTAQADCPVTLPLDGFVTIEHCDPAGGQCVRADTALVKYIDAMPDDGPSTLSIAMQGSPWHLYDAQYHILEVDELAAMVRQQGSKIERVVLVASWSATAPDPRAKSLAQKLSLALGGMPVTGQDGFLWVSPNGAIHTTHQAYTGRLSGPYLVGKNDKIMASLVAGWVLDMEDMFIRTRDAGGLLRTGAAKEIFMLCPEGALQAYDASAALDNPIAAFNAAILRLERAAPGDAAAALSLLKQSAALGDKKAEAKLKSLVRTPQVQ
jgi:hypothetical protein